ncbi:MAG: Fic family protein [Legionellales bacterium]
MKKIDKKLAVLMAIKQMHEPISLPDLLKYLGEGYAERTTRRWLQELIEEKLLEKKGQKRGTLYFVKPETLIPQISPMLFTKQDEIAIAYVKQPLYTRKPISYQIQWLASYVPNKTFYLSVEQRTVLKKQGERSYTNELAGTYARHIYNRLLIDLSYNSSRLEGNTYSLLDTEKLIIEGVSAPDKLEQEKVMILNHKEAIRYLIDNAERMSIDVHTIRNLHYLLADGLLMEQGAGNLRGHAVKIGGSTYLPLDNKVQLEQTLDLICKKAEQISDPYEQSFFLLVHMAYLQAFEDVNKRTARLSANIPLIKNNLVPLSFNDVPKDDYSAAMVAVYELNDTNPLASLYHFSYLRTCEQYDANVESIGFDRIKVTYRAERRKLLKDIIVMAMTGEEIQRYIGVKTQDLIPIADQSEFIKTINEDIRGLDISRIAGLGITKEQLIAWQELQKK